MTLRKVTKNWGSFPSQEAAFKLLYLALMNATKKWQTPQGWREAFAAVYDPLGESDRGGAGGLNST